MKKIILALVSMMTFSVHAVAGGDQTYQTVACTLAEDIPDMMVSLKVFEGGFSGMPQVQVINHQWGRPTSTQNYFTKKTTVPTINGSTLIIYTGQGIQLNINTSVFAAKKGFQSEFIMSRGSYNWTRKFNCQLLVVPQGLK